MDLVTAVQSITSGDRWTVSEPGWFRRVYVRGIAETGMPFLPPPELDEERALGEVRSWLNWAAEPRAAPNAVYMDTTTLTAVMDVLEERELETASHLLDLATFAENVILFDTIVHLASRQLDSYRFNERLENERIVLALPVLHAAPAVSEFVQQTWHNMSGEVQDMLKARDADDNRYEERHELLRAWAVLLNVDAFDDEVFREAHYQVGNLGWPSQGQQLLERLIERLSPTTESTSLFPDMSLQGKFELIAECNYRAAFNEAMAYALRLPYTPNTLRLPILRWRRREASQAQAVLLASKVLDPALRSLLASFPSFADSPPLPFFLTAILGRIDSLDQFYEVLLELRHAAAPLRKRRAAIETALREGRGREARDLATAIAADTRALRLNLLRAGAGGIAAFFAAVTQAPLVIAINGIGILTAMSQTGSDDYQTIARRLFDPTWTFLHDTTQMAMDLGSVQAKAQKLWNLHPRSAAAIESHLQRLAALP